MKNLLSVIAGLGIVALIFNSCSKVDSGATGSNPSRPAGSFTYSTTSNVGDYAEWTFDGSTISATWKVINSSGNVDVTYGVTASCPTFNSTYGYYTCTISTGSCTDGAITCTGNPSGSFEMMEVPNTAIFVHTSGGGSQLHVGLLKDSAACSANVSGDYVYVRTGVGNRDLFGLYSTDADFDNATHADFQMVAGSASATPAVTYTTTDASGTGAVTFTDNGCSGGVRSRGIGGGNARAMLTNSGLFILDLPSGQGGLVSFKMTNAASLADFANKTFGGISFPDNGTPNPLNVVTGAVSGQAVTISSGDANGNPIVGADIRPLTNTTSTVTNPSYPDFTVAPSAGSFAYSSNTVFQPTYANPSLFPGFFRVDGSLGGDSGRVMMAAAKLNGKVVGFGFTYNWRTTSDTNPNGGNYSSPGLYNTGNFIIFER